jgi:hypothetical protein
MNEWEEEAWNTTAPPQYNFDQPEEPVREIPSFEVNTRPGYRSAPPQQQQPIVGGPYSRMINSNWQNPDYGPAQGGQQVTQGWANIPAGAYQFGESMIKDPIGTAKAFGQAIVDPQTYVEAGKSAIGAHGVEGMSEFWTSMALPMPKIQKGALWNAIKDKPGTKNVREKLDGVGVTRIKSRPDRAGLGWEQDRSFGEVTRDSKDWMKMASEYLKENPHARTMWGLSGKDPGAFGVNRNLDLWNKWKHDGVAGIHHPSTLSVTVPEIKTPFDMQVNRHEKLHALFAKRHRQMKRGITNVPLSKLDIVHPDGLGMYASWPHFRSPPGRKIGGQEYSWYNGAGSNYLDEATAYVGDVKSVTEGLKSWGKHLSQGKYYHNHGGRGVGYLTRGIGHGMDISRKAWNAGEGALPRVVRTGIMMHDSPSRGLPAENTEIDRTRFYSP